MKNGEMWKRESEKTEGADRFYVESEYIAISGLFSPVRSFLEGGEITIIGFYMGSVRHFLKYGIICGSLISVSVANAEEIDDIEIPKVKELTDLKGKFDEKVHELELPIRTLENLYEKQLDKLRESLQKKGNLDAVLEIEAEKKSFRERGSDDPEDTTIGELRQSQKLYQQSLNQRKNSIIPERKLLNDQYLSGVENIAKLLTTENRIEDAVAVNGYAKKLDPPPVVEVMEIELFWMTDFQGASVKLKVPVSIERFGQVAELKNDSLRSIRIPDGVTVTVADGANLQGKSIRMKKDTADIEIGGISSLKAR